MVPLVRDRVRGGKAVSVVVGEPVNGEKDVIVDRVRRKAVLVDQRTTVIVRVKSRDRGRGGWGGHDREGRKAVFVVQRTTVVVLVRSKNRARAT